METITILLSVFGTIFTVSFTLAFIKVYIKKEPEDYLEKYRTYKVEEKKTEISNITNIVEELKKKAAISNKTNFQSNSSTIQQTSLSRVIKTKEAGELFMKRLKSL